MTNLTLIHSKCQQASVNVEAEIILALIEELNLNPEAVTIKKGETSNEVRINNMTYLIVDETTAEYEAYQAVYALIKHYGYQSLDIDLMPYIIHEFLEECCEEVIRKYIYGLDDEELADYFRAFHVSSCTDVVDCLMEDPDYMDYLLSFYTYKELISLAEEFDMFLDYELVGDLIKKNGRGYYLAQVDQIENTLEVAGTIYYAYWCF